MTNISPTPLFDNLDAINTARKKIPEYLCNVAQNNVEADYRYASEFLYSYRGSKATFNAYRHELERLLQWCWFIVGKQSNNTHLRLKR